MEAQVAPVAAGEAFAVDVDGARVAVHGTHLRVERQGGHAIVDLREGVVSIGLPPKSGATYGDLVTAPAHIEFDVADPHGTLKVSHESSRVRAAISLDHPSDEPRRTTAPPPRPTPAPPSPPRSRGEARARRTGSARAARRDAGASRRSQPARSAAARAHARGHEPRAHHRRGGPRLRGSTSSEQARRSRRHGDVPPRAARRRLRNGDLRAVRPAPRAGRDLVRGTGDLRDALSKPGRCDDPDRHHAVVRFLLSGASGYHQRP